MDNYKFIKAHDTLNPILWDGFKLKPEVEMKLSEIAQFFAENFLNNINIPFTILENTIVGSNVSYNYNETSDIDLHIIIDFIDYNDMEKIDLAKELCDAYRTIFNLKYTPTIFGIKVELYVEFFGETPNKSEAKYCLAKGWSRKPQKAEFVEINAKEVEAKYKTIADELDDILNDNLSFKEPKEQVEIIDRLINKIYELRSDNFSKNDDYGSGNIAFKRLRANGYIDFLKNLKTKIENCALSLDKK